MPAITCILLPLESIFLNKTIPTSIIASSSKANDKWYKNILSQTTLKVPINSENGQEDISDKQDFYESEQHNYFDFGYKTSLFMTEDSKDTKSDNIKLDEARYSKQLTIEKSELKLECLLSTNDSYYSAQTGFPQYTSVFAAFSANCEHMYFEIFCILLV